MHVKPTILVIGNTEIEPYDQLKKFSNITTLNTLGRNGQTLNVILFEVSDHKRITLDVAEASLPAETPRTVADAVAFGEQLSTTIDRPALLAYSPNVPFTPQQTEQLSSAGYTVLDAPRSFYQAKDYIKEQVAVVAPARAYISTRFVQDALSPQRALA